MSEEAAFLMALKANPADDTARLVYADWLDEHDQPHKAEYLRAVVEVARAPEDAAASERVLAVASEIELDWRLAAGARFALILDDCKDRIRTIKWLREVLGIGLGEANHATHDVPYIVLNLEPWETARDELAKSPGAEIIRTRLVPVQGPTHDNTAHYSLYVRCTLYPRLGATEAEVTQSRAEAHAAFARVIEVARSIALDPKETDRSECILLAHRLTRSELRRIRARLATSLPGYNPAQSWGVWLDFN